MIKKFIIATIAGFVILGLPWKPPYTYWENAFILLGYVLAFIPGFILLILVLNRLINISFTTKG